MLAQVLREAHRLQHLELLGEQRLGVEGDGFLHGGERHQLQEVVLDDVTGGADAVVVTGPAADADVLGHRDLDVVDVRPVPDRLVHLVGEAQRQYVLDGFLAQVVVDAEHLVRLEHVVHERVQLTRARQVAPERLLDDRAPPGPLGCLRQPVLLQLLDDLGEELRRHGEVEGVVAAGAAGRVEVVHRLAQCLERRVVVEVAGDEPHPLGELLPDLFAEVGAGVLTDGVMHDLREVLVLPVAAGETHQGEARRQQTAVGQVVDGRHQLLAGQVSGDAEDDEPGRPGDPRQPPVAPVAQRVGPLGGHSPSTPLLSSAFVTAASRSSQAASNLATPSSSRRCTTSS